MRTTLLPPQTIKRLQQHARTLPFSGTVVCAGCYGGGDIVAMSTARPDLHFIAIDSWEGLAEPSMIDSPNAHAGKFAYDFDEFMLNLDRAGAKAFAFKMWISKDTIKDVVIDKVDMLWVDLDHAQPTKVVLDYFLPKCTKEAHVLTHDYNNPNYPGIRHVCNQHGEWEELGHTLARLKR